MKLSRRDFIMGAGLCAMAAISSSAISKLESAPFIESTITAESFAKDLNTLKDNQNEGVSTGFKDLDGVLGSLRGGSLVIIAARPSLELMPFTLNIARKVAQRGTPVAFFSLAMSAKYVARCVLAAESRTNIRNIKSGCMNAQNLQRVTKAADNLANTPLYFDDTPLISVPELRKKAKRMLPCIKPGKGLIIVDYLELMRPQSPNIKSRYEIFAEITFGLKTLAREMNIPVIVTSHLRGSIETRFNKRPNLRDLRESTGTIEQDSDVVMFLDQSISEEEAMIENRPNWRMADVIVAKHRYGPCGKVNLVCFEECARFDNYKPFTPDLYAK